MRSTSQGYRLAYCALSGKASYSFLELDLCTASATVSLLALVYCACTFLDEVMACCIDAIDGGLVNRQSSPDLVDQLDPAVTLPFVCA